MANVFWNRKGPHEQSKDGAFYVHDISELDKEFKEIVEDEDETPEETS